MLEWISSYIRGRTQRVQIGRCLSDPIAVTSSVAQGSHLGPILFSLFINDVVTVLKNVSFSIFADDLKISHKIQNYNDCEVLQDALNKLDNYIKGNGLKLNVKKCLVTSFTLKTSTRIEYPYKVGSSLLTRVKEVRDLGIIYDEILLDALECLVFYPSNLSSVAPLCRAVEFFKWESLFELWSTLRSELLALPGHDGYRWMHINEYS